MTPIVCEKIKNIRWSLPFRGAEQIRIKKWKIRVEERKIRKEEKVSVHGEKIHALIEKFI